MTNFLRMQSCKATRHHEWMRQTQSHTLPLFWFPFSPLCLPLSLTLDTHSDICTRITEERERRSVRGSLIQTQRTWSRTGKGYSCAVLPLHSFLLGWSFPTEGERDCPRGPWENRKCTPTGEKARWNLFAGLVLWGGWGPLLERQFVRRYPSYRQGGSHRQQPLWYLVTDSTLTPTAARSKQTPSTVGKLLAAAAAKYYRPGMLLES